MWDAFKDLIFWGINAVYGLVGDWGMSIIITTILFRLLLVPLMRGQIKSSYQMQKMQPLMQELQERYKDDPMRLQEEMQKLYADAKFNPLAGCLPMLLQIPIFIAFFQALRNIDQYVSYQGVFTFYNIIPDLQVSPADALAVSFETFVPYLTLLIIYVVATFLPMLVTPTANNQSKTSMYIMAGVMSLMMLWVGWRSPAGVILYWGVSSLLGVLQTTLSRRYYNKQFDQIETELQEKQAKVEVERRVKKKRPTKKH